MTLAASYSRVRTRRSPHFEMLPTSRPPPTDSASEPGPDRRRSLSIGGCAMDRRLRLQRPERSGAKADGRFEATVLGLPVVQRRFRRAVLARQIGRLRARLMLPQNA